MLFSTVVRVALLDKLLAPAIAPEATCVTNAVITAWLASCIWARVAEPPEAELEPTKAELPITNTFATWTAAACTATLPFATGS